MYLLEPCIVSLCLELRLGCEKKRFMSAERAAKTHPQMTPDGHGCQAFRIKTVAAQLPMLHKTCRILVECTSST